MDNRPFDIAPVRTRAGRGAYNELSNRLSPYFATTLEEFEHRLQWVPENQRLHLIASAAGKPVGIASVERCEWRPESPFASANVMVDEAHQRRGIGTALYGRVSAFARELGLGGLRVHLIETETAGLRYWQQRDFHEVERFIDVALDVDSFDVPAFELPQGMQFVTLAERPDLLREFYNVIDESLEDIPAAEPTQIPPFAQWERLIRQAPGFRPDVGFLALALDAGGGGQVAGVAELELLLAQPEVAWNGFTAVRRPFRRQGIARALKYTAIAAAKELGIRQLRTENEVRNTPMRTLNIELGYRPLPVRMQLHGPLASEPSGVVG